MLRIIFFTSLVISSAFGAKFIGETEQTLEHAYIPNGFDSDDSIQIVVTGKFSKPCQQLGLQNSEVDPATQNIWVELTAYEYEGNCTNPDLTFQKTIYLGLIHKPGTYKVWDRASNQKIGELVVDKAPSSGVGTDSKQYAPLTDAFLWTEEGKNYLILRGVNRSYCGSISEVKFHAYEDTLVVLPRFGSPYTPCSTEAQSFEKKVLVEGPLPKRPFLLHVRAMGGQAFNKLNF